MVCQVVCFLSLLGIKPLMLPLFLDGAHVKQLEGPCPCTHRLVSEVFSQTHEARMCFERGLLSSLSPKHTNNCCVHCSIAVCTLPGEHWCRHKQGKVFSLSPAFWEEQDASSWIIQALKDGPRGKAFCPKSPLTSSKLQGTGMCFIGCSLSFLTLSWC